MLKLSIALCFVVAALAGPTPRIRPYIGHKVLTVTPVTQDQVEWLEALRVERVDVDFWNDAHLNKDVYIHVTPEAEPEILSYMELMGLHHEVKLNDLQMLMDLEADAQDKATYSSDSAVGRYVMSSEIFNLVKGLSQKYSNIMSYQQIGHSFEGRPLLVTKFSTGENRPAIFFNGGMHPREWIAHASVVWIMNEFATKYGRDEKITSFLDTFDVYIEPLVNPDGYDYTHTGKRLWRKTRSTHNGADACLGADPNRNFDIKFGGVGTSHNPCSDIYHGVSAHSEVEIQALVSFLATIPNLYMYIDVHAFSQLWLTPNGYRDERPENYKEIDRIATAGANAFSAVNGKKFTVGTPPALLYAVAGGSFDYALEVLNVKYAYALELRPENDAGMFGFFVPAAEIPDSGRETMAGIMAAAMAMERGTTLPLPPFPRNV